MKKNTLFFMITLLCVSCTSPQPTTLIKGTVIAVDPYRNDNVSVYDLFDAVEIIPLESKENELFTFRGTEGFTGVAFQGNYYFHDRKQAAVFIFDGSGKFLQKIAKKGEGPEEYLSLDCFTVNRFTGYLEILSSYTGCIYVYDLKKEKLIERIKWPYSLPVIHSFHQFSKDIYVLYAHYSGDKQEMFFYSKTEGSVVGNDYSLPEWLGKTGFSNSDSPFYLFGDSLRFQQFYDGAVFSISPETFQLEPLYSWDFGKHSFHYSVLPQDEPATFFLDLIKTISDEYAVGILSYAENSNYYFTRFEFKRKSKWLIYRKANKSYLSFDKFTEGGECRATWVDEEYMYTFISPEIVHEVIRPSMLDEKNRLILEGIGEEDNPVVIKYRFKK